MTSAERKFSLMEQGTENDVLAQHAYRHVYPLLLSKPCHSA